MTRRRVGLWLVGAFGGVGTTITLGLAAMTRGLADRTGLVTEHPLFAGLPLPEPGDFVIGGHDIRQTSFGESAEEFRANSGVFDAGWISSCQEELAAATARVRPGTHFGAGRAIAGLGHWGDARPPRTAAQAVDRVAADMAAFVDTESIDHLIVLNVASTEPPFATRPTSTSDWDLLNAGLADGGPELCPPAPFTLWPRCGAATPTSTSPPAWAPRSLHSTSWPSRPARSTAARTARPARR